MDPIKVATIFNTIVAKEDDIPPVVDLVLLSALCQSPLVGSGEEWGVGSGETCGDALCRWIAAQHTNNETATDTTHRQTAERESERQIKKK